MRDDLIACAAIDHPFAPVLLRPEGEFIPYLADAESLVRVPCGDLEHGEGADLRKVFRLLDHGDFRAQFHVRQPKGAGAGSAPVEFEGWTGGVNLHRGAIHAAKYIELVMPIVDRDRIVGLKRRSLGPQAAGG